MNTTKETPRARAKRRNEEWRKALAQSRVLKFDGGKRLVAYATQSAREDAYDKAIKAGVNVELIEP
jgi:hypothetical protein